VFDTIHNILRTAGDPQALRGSFPHRRILTSKKSENKKFVAGLPHLSLYKITCVRLKPLNSAFGQVYPNLWKSAQMPALPDWCRSASHDVYSSASHLWWAIYFYLNTLSHSVPISPHTLESLSTSSIAL
jgi:hypothetical protein